MLAIVQSNMFEVKLFSAEKMTKLRYTLFYVIPTVARFKWHVTLLMLLLLLLPVVEQPDWLLEVLNSDLIFLS